MSSKHRSVLQKHRTRPAFGDTLGITDAFEALLFNVCPKELIPSKEELSLLISTKEEADTWCGLLQSVHGSANNEECHKEALEERERLKLELESIRTTADTVEQELVHLEERMSALERERQRAAKQTSDSSCKASLLSAYLLATEEKCGILEEFGSHLGKILVVPSPSEKTYFQRLDRSAPGGIVLETACTRSLRSACQCVLTLQSAVDTEMRHKHAKEVEKQLNAIGAGYSPEEVMASMVECALKEEEALKHLTAAVDLQREAAELNCVWSESHSWVDAATGAGNSPSEIIQCHIKDIQLAHISSAVGCQAALHQANPLKKEIDQWQQELDSLLCVQCQGDVEALLVARSVTQLEMEEVGQRAACAHLQATLQRLGGREGELKSAFVELQKKHSQIKEFSKLVESKQTCIQALVQHRASLEGRLRQLQQQSEAYRRRRICTQEVALTSLFHRLEGSVMKEAQAFCGADLLALRTTPAPHRLTLSEMALHWTEQQGLLHQEVLRSRGVVACATGEELLPQVASLAEEGGNLQKELSDSPEINSDGVIGAIDVMNKVQANKKEDTKLMVTLLSEARGADRLAGQCDLLEQSIQNWWSCPAQGLLPWVTREGMSFQEWTKQWSALAAKSRSLQKETTEPKLASPLPPTFAV